MVEHEHLRNNLMTIFLENMIDEMCIFNDLVEGLDFHYKKSLN